MKNLLLRPYAPADCERLANLFYDTVHTVNARDYTEEQCRAWATGQVDLAGWNRSFLENCTLVALIGDTIVGFGDIDWTGYLDHLYVHKDNQRQGIASALCDQLETMFPIAEVTAHASITARPFFEQRGYTVVRKQQVERHGVFLTNYVMKKVFQ
ncbi:MAG: GNAT family N-acetyltransferase [Eubacteriales bacterium]